MRFFVAIAILLGLGLTVLVAVDVAATPPAPAPGQCVLQDNYLLPDRCRSSCPSGIDCPTTQTRSYLLFWTEAAGCPDGIICG